MKKLVLYLNIFISITLVVVGYDWRIGILYWLLWFLGFKFLRSLKSDIGSEEYLVYKIVFMVFMSYMFLTHSVNITDPLEDYFFHNDQLVFYGDAERISAFNWNEIPKASIYNLRYSEYPFFSLLIGSFFKISTLLHIKDKLLALKMGIVVLASLIPPIIGIILSIIHKEWRANSLIRFSVLGYIIVQSSVFSRDLPVAFFYSLLAYLLIYPSLRFRVLKMLLICLVTTGFRIEHGIYALALPLVFIWQESGTIKKIVFSISCVAIFYYYDLAGASINLFLEAISVFHEHTASSSTNIDSLYLRFAALPFPLNILFGFVYTSIMPFPLFSWVSEDYTLILSVINPFYWSFIILMSFWAFVSKKETKYFVKVLFIFSIMFIALSSYIEPTVRRNFAVYPLIFLYFMSTKEGWTRDAKISGLVYSTATVLTINLFAYMYILFKI